jgi:flagellar hook protein FlgE
MSFYTSLSGLKAAQSDLAVTSNNIANVGTVGFKKSSSQFGDIISASPLQSSAIAGQGTRLKGIDQQFTQGGFQSSERSLDLALSGQGFFVTKTGITNGSITYTRNGSFSVDANRYVVDNSGAYVQVLPTDASGTITATGIASARNLQLPLTSGLSRATSSIDLSLNLPNTADIPSTRSVYDPTTNPYSFDRFDLNSFNQQAATTVYDIQGNAMPATIYYTRQTTPTNATPTSTWEARLFVGDSQVSADGNAATVPPTPLILTFDTNGNLTGQGYNDASTSPATYTPITTPGPISYAQVQPAGAAAALGLTVDYGANTRQTSSPFTVKTFNQDGYAAGQLDNVTVDSTGLVTASFSNGTSQALGKIMIANFTNPEGLRQLGDAKWAATGASGDPQVGAAGSNGFGSVASGSLEQANVDITEELVALIQAQRNFQANAKAIDTANQMTQTVVNLRN